jgi:DNA polymerase-3 subunit delta'
VEAADRQARLSSDIAAEVATAQAYNLDRKQTILSILEAAR